MQLVQRILNPRSVYGALPEGVFSQLGAIVLSGRIDFGDQKFTSSIDPVPRGDRAVLV